ncbi:Uncharacterised protein [Yersinia kristensenii]|nr:hypothetical protein ykris0001_22510 [Yersinia kristensenii ATCC 33638]EEP93478.1 hypothetical protein ykris0001_36100 [Yersinia kristensenii ATCC 33638]SUP68155.1 Uncharacterised protein [Yersinia kristensenii]
MRIQPKKEEKIKKGEQGLAYLDNQQNNFENNKIGQSK